MAQIPAWHKHDCSGCPLCDAELASLSAMSQEEYSTWLKNGGHNGKKWPRTACSRPTAEAPDPYAAGIAKMRATMPERIDMTADLDPRHKADSRIPPDGYALGLALDRAKKETR